MCLWFGLFIFIVLMKGVILLFMVCLIIRFILLGVSKFFSVSVFFVGF